MSGEIREFSPTYFENLNSRLKCEPPAPFWVMRNLEVLAGHFAGQVLRGAHRQRENGHCGVLPARARKAGAIDDEEILVIVALVELVEHTLFRIVAHSAGANFVKAVAGRVGHRILRQDLEARGLGDL
jgi:hypothetical protein